MKDMMTIQINDNVLRKTLRHIERAGTDLTPLMRAIAGTLKTETDFNFEDEGRPAWQPSLAALDRNGMTLSKTGHLRKSITVDYSSEHATIGTNVEYGPIHQLGGNAGRNQTTELPARPYLPVDESGDLQAGVEQKLLNSALSYLQNAAQA